MLFTLNTPSGPLKWEYGLVYLHFVSAKELHLQKKEVLWQKIVEKLISVWYPFPVLSCKFNYRNEIIF